MELKGIVEIAEAESRLSDERKSITGTLDQEEPIKDALWFKETLTER